jgi:hypothetical protein
MWMVMKDHVPLTIRGVSNVAQQESSAACSARRELRGSGSVS